jgi:hypothetical protein
MRWSFFLYLAFFIAISAVVNAAEGEIVDEYQMNEAINDAAQQAESTFAFDQYEEEEEFIPVRNFNETSILNKYHAFMQEKKYLTLLLKTLTGSGGGSATPQARGRKTS